MEVSSSSNQIASNIGISNIWKPMLTGKIKNQIDQVWEMFWTGGVSNPISVIEQISYLLFIRRLDEIQRTAELKSQTTGQELTNPIFSKKEASLRWNNFKDKDPNEMFEIVQNQVFPKIKTLQSQGSFAKHMKDAIFMIPSPKLLDQVVQLLSNINMSDKDTKGDLYEYLLSKLASAGVNGQFRTPRHIIKMMVQCEHMNNTTVRDRFGIDVKNSAMASRVIKDTVSAGLIRPYDADAGTKAMRYIPHWA